MCSLLSTSPHADVALAVDTLNYLCGLASNASKAATLGAVALLTPMKGCKGASFDFYIGQVLAKLATAPPPHMAAAAAPAAAPSSSQPVAAPAAPPLQSTPPVTSLAASVASMGISSAAEFETFVRAYDAAEAPEFCDQLLGFLRQTIFAAGRKYGASEEAARDFLKRLQLQTFSHKEELASNMAESAALIWTSAEKLRLGPGNTVEFCSLLNRILRERDPDLLALACGVVRGINLLCVTRRDPSKLRFPPGGKSHRGGGLPAAHAPFFSVGKKFRVPMYLATSFDEDVAYK
jgi:hypothetical protein